MAQLPPSTGCPGYQGPGTAQGSRHESWPRITACTAAAACNLHVEQNRVRRGPCPCPHAACCLRRRQTVRCCQTVPCRQPALRCQLFRVRVLPPEAEAGARMRAVTGSSRRLDGRGSGAGAGGTGVCRGEEGRLIGPDPKNWRSLLDKLLAFAALLCAYALLRLSLTFFRRSRSRSSRKVAAAVAVARNARNRGRSTEIGRLDCWTD